MVFHWAHLHQPYKPCFIRVVPQQSHRFVMTLLKWYKVKRMRRWTSWTHRGGLKTDKQTKIDNLAQFPICGRHRKELGCNWTYKEPFCCLQINKRAFHELPNTMIRQWTVVYWKGCITLLCKIGYDYWLKHLLRPDEVLKRGHYNLRKNRLWQLPNKTLIETRWGINNRGIHEGNKTQWNIGEKGALQS